MDFKLTTNKKSEAEVFNMINEVDEDGSGSIDFGIFEINKIIENPC